MPKVTKEQAPARLYALDTLRGLAALAIVLFHTRRFYPGAGGELLFSHGYLAVDFFFMLSGFVIAFAYEERLSRPTALRRFVVDRVIRLQPILVLGTALSIVITMVTVLSNGTRLPPYFFVDALVAAIPLPSLWHLDGRNIFPLNPPTWSLAYEYLVNFLYAALSPWLSTRVLAGLVALAAILMVAMSIDAGGVTFSMGHNVVRAAAAFPLGVLLFRLHRTGRVRLPAWLGAAAAPLLLLTFVLVPYRSPLSAIYDPLVILGIYPLLILAGAAHEPRLPPLARVLGNLSYPLYVLHYPVTRVMVLMFPEQRRDADLWFGVVVVALSIAVSLAAWRFYDEPVRRRLRKWINRADAAAKPPPNQ